MHGDVYVYKRARHLSHEEARAERDRVRLLQTTKAHRTYCASLKELALSAHLRNTYPHKHAHHTFYAVHKHTNDVPMDVLDWARGLKYCGYRDDWVEADAEEEHIHWYNGAACIPKYTVNTAHFNVTETDPSTLAK
jgi:hypothetical protein